MTLVTECYSTALSVRHIFKNNQSAWETPLPRVRVRLQEARGGADQTAVHTWLWFQAFTWMAPPVPMPAGSAVTNRTSLTVYFNNPGRPCPSRIPRRFLPLFGAGGSFPHCFKCGQTHSATRSMLVFSELYCPLSLLTYFPFHVVLNNNNNK